MTVREKLFAACSTLAPHCHSTFGWYAGHEARTGEPTWNHWSGGLDALRAVLGRRLTDAELTVYSLALGFGPTPLDPMKADGSSWETSLMRVVWPDRNPCGNFLTPGGVMDRLGGRSAPLRREFEFKVSEEVEALLRGVDAEERRTCAALGYHPPRI